MSIFHLPTFNLKLQVLAPGQWDVGDVGDVGHVGHVGHVGDVGFTLKH